MKKFALAAVVLALTNGANASSGARLHYRMPAEDSIVGWERQSLPLGCGHFGWNVFGIVTNERVQVTHNAVLTRGNLTNALEIRLRTEAADVTGYERSLDLESAVAEVRYESSGVTYRREFFTSYPDRVGVMRLTASEMGRLAFVLGAEVPFPVPFGDKAGRGRRGTVRAKGASLDVDQELEWYGIRFASALRVETDGKVTAEDGSLRVADASEATVWFACDTNYRVETKNMRYMNDTERPRVILPDVDPRPGVEATLAAAMKRGYAETRRRHVSDYRSLAGRVNVDLGGCEADGRVLTDDLLHRYAKGERSAWLEELYFRYGRYLLISSSRPGTLPANLQGVWTAHEQSPWGCGYWHNINVQMNYWPAFSTNLRECFEPYADFNAAFRPVTRPAVNRYFTRYGLRGPLAPNESPDIWSIGVGTFPCDIDADMGGHSGPGMGGLTTRLFWDWWDFTRDRSVLEKHLYPVYHGMADLLTQCVRSYDGLCLAAPSASPEQLYNGPFCSRANCYVTLGCAFDQEMIEGNNREFLKIVELMGAREDEVTKRVRGQIGKYDPIQIGWSGQIKEFREETFYGSIGEYRHRHISQLMALMPGDLITRETPAWLDAARVSLDGRGDQSTGWALAHRMNARARTLQGNKAHVLLENLLSERTNDNLWDMHPPFQIDGNFGATAAIAEMLIQSHCGSIDLLPALPDAWAKRGSFRGLCARGGFEVDCEWADGAPVRVCVRTTAGGVPKVRYDGREVVLDREGDAYVCTAFAKKLPRTAAPGRIRVDRAGRTVSWEPSATDGARYSVYRNIRSRPDYELVASAVTGTSVVDGSVDFAREEYVTYKVVASCAGMEDSEGSLHTCSRATQLEKDRYILQVKNVNGIGLDPEDID